MEEIKKLKAISKTSSLTPDTIASKLFSYHSKAHLYHLQTTSFAQHKMLDELYEELEDSKDSICEYLLGIQAPKRFGTVTMEQAEPFSDVAVTKFLQDIFDFSVALCSYAEEKNLEQLCNLSSELQGEAVRAQYLNTLR